MAFVEYFGELPPARDGSQFQMTGYLIGDRDRFDAAGLVPVDLPQFAHGQHRGQEFWMYEQEFDYYRRHLLIHEATHCFMMIMPGVRPPLWYLEGMAELFATHRIDAAGQATFAVMPHTPEEFLGFSRIEMIQQQVADDQLFNLDQVTRLGVREFSLSRSTPYAWSWAICKFLDTHPQYRQRFRELGQHLVGTEFQRLAEESFAADKLLLAAEWDQFVRGIDYGWDFDAHAFVTHDGPAQELSSPVEVIIRADRGWQSTGFRVRNRQRYAIDVQGRVSLGNAPRPWISEPQGITIQYANGLPIGRVQVAVLVEVDQQTGGIVSIPLEVHDCGRGGAFQFRHNGTLLFRINDLANARQDNSGVYSAMLRPIE